MEQTEIGIQATKDTKETPGIIKKLTAGLILFFITTFTLIFVEATLHHIGINTVHDWLNLAKDYGIRYVILSYLSSSPLGYNIYRKYNPVEVLESHYNRTKMRIDRLYKLNVLTRQYLEELNIVYDYEILMTTSGGQTFPTLFLYAMIIYLKEITTYTSADPKIAKECINDNSNLLCSVINNSLQYCFDNGLYSTF